MKKFIYILILAFNAAGALAQNADFQEDSKVCPVSDIRLLVEQSGGERHVQNILIDSQNIKNVILSLGKGKDIPYGTKTFLMSWQGSYQNKNYKCIEVSGQAYAFDGPCRICAELR